MNLNNYKYNVVFEAFNSETNSGFLVKEEPVSLKKLA